MVLVPLSPAITTIYNVQVQTDLSRLNAEQLIAIKHLALIASGGNTETINRRPDPLIDRLYDQMLAQEEQERVERDFGKLRRQQTGRKGLL